jgi:hypothetical protein
MARKTLAKHPVKTATKTATKTASKSAPKAAARTVTRREWTKEDVRELKKLVREKTPARSIATTMERSEGAVRQKAFGEGLSFRKRPAGTRRK